MSKNNTSNTICPSKANINVMPSKTPAERNLKKAFGKSRSTCLKYEKCSKAKCDFPDLEFKNLLMKEDPNKMINIVQKCLNSDDRTLCTLDEYSKMSPQLKNIIEKVKKCKTETCVKVHDKHYLANTEMKTLIPNKTLIKAMNAFKAMKKGSMKKGSMKKGSMKKGSMKRGSMKKGSMKRGSTKSKSK